jgi:hypothetical protein
MFQSQGPNLLALLIEALVNDYIVKDKLNFSHFDWIFGCSLQCLIDFAILAGPPGGHHLATFASGKL